MKILSASQTREADHYTIRHEPVASIDLMERAATAFTAWFLEKFSNKHPVSVFCGTGNNGGDGLAVARLLKAKKYTVRVFAARYSDGCSADFLKNEKRLKKLKLKITDIREGSAFPQIAKNEIIIDGLWGSGLNRPVEGFAARLIEHLNNAPATRVAIDIPSGLYADSHSPSLKFKADYTLTFQLPKLSFFFPENAAFVGELITRPIGLHSGFLEKAKTENHCLTLEMARSLIVPRSRTAHKGTFGHALILSGSFGKMGAAVLCAEACLRAGAGLVTVRLPRCGCDIMQTALPEAMVSADENETHLTKLPELSPYKAIAIGPGTGKHRETAKAIRHLLKTSKTPLILDADALNILSENKSWLQLLPENSILTPHPKEFERLLGKGRNDFEHFAIQKEASRKYNVIIVLKRAHTVISLPDGSAYFNMSGNPGMATGGSGDVLTGVIAGLFSQGYSPAHSALLGVYWHGLAGDLAAAALSQPAMLAGDINKHLGAAFLKILG